MRDRAITGLAREIAFVVVCAVVAICPFVAFVMVRGNQATLVGNQMEMLKHQAKMLENQRVMLEMFKQQDRILLEGEK